MPASCGNQVAERHADLTEKQFAVDALVAAVRWADSTGRRNTFKQEVFMGR
jgi:hypothetical protein